METNKKGIPKILRLASLKRRAKMNLLLSPCSDSLSLSTLKRCIQSLDRSNRHLEQHNLVAHLLATTVHYQYTSLQPSFFNLLLLPTRQKQTVGQCTSASDINACRRPLAKATHHSTNSKENPRRVFRAKGKYLSLVAQVIMVNGLELFLLSSDHLKHFHTT